MYINIPLWRLHVRVVCPTSHCVRAAALFETRTRNFKHGDHFNYLMRNVRNVSSNKSRSGVNPFYVWCYTQLHTMHPRCWPNSKHNGDVGPTSAYCWANVVDGGSTVNQRWARTCSMRHPSKHEAFVQCWADASCLLGYYKLTRALTLTISTAIN